MDFVEACELGREPVNSVNAAVLATVLRELVTRYHQTRRNKFHSIQLRCGEQLEIQRRRRRKVDDEGFGSDEDTGSTTSSSCLVEDHVFMGRKIEVDRASPSTTSITASIDSANSSGSSDTDEVESPAFITSKEHFPLKNVIFCHTEPRHPNTIAWVIKKKTSFFDNSTSRLGKTGVEKTANDSCLDVIVVKCKSFQDFKKLCDSYRETSRRLKLDQYKSVNRKKPIVLTSITDTKDMKISLSDMKVGKSSLLKASELSILNPKIMSSFKSDLKSSVSLNSLLKDTARDPSPVQKEESMKKAMSLSNIAPNKFNLVQRTDYDGITHTEVSKVNKSKVQKEIEGVILTDIDVRREPVRQRQTEHLETLWRPEESVEPPPQRPERRKYTKKKGQAPKPPVTTLPTMPEAKSKSKFYLPIHDEGLNAPLPNSQYIRLQSWPEKDKPLSIWTTNERCSRKDERITDKRRTRSVGRTPKTPMAYRYIDIIEPNKKVDQTDGARRRRRNSFDDDMMQQKSSLKPVIKNQRSMTTKMTEPKKVTFSAYATVQMVD